MEIRHAHIAGLIYEKDPRMSTVFTLVLPGMELIIHSNPNDYGYNEWPEEKI
jgi:hypothetical protein